jgi:uncharacterized NAD(P)/FAD-binding protein YdhS
MPESIASPFTPPERIAIIGGGFSGVMTAVNLARLSRLPLEIAIVNQGRPLGRGAAYGTRRPEHLLNVAARNMSAFPDLPDHFLQWLRTRAEFDLVPDAELRERFIPRTTFGDYLRGLMHQHLEAPMEAIPVRTRFIAGEAIDVELHERGATVRLADGGELRVDKVVLATGNEPPAPIPGSELLHNHPGWIGNPWITWENRLPPTGGTIIVLGTGLTTVDAVITLRSLGWNGLIHAVSRNGWLPHSHFRGIEYTDFPPKGADLADLGLEKLLALVEHHCARLRDFGANPAIIVDKMRASTQRIWQRFSREEKIEFVKRHSARWNVLRHRIAPEIHAQVTTAQLTGQLRIHAAGIEGVATQGDRLAVKLAGDKTLFGDLVINATGPNAKFTGTRVTLLQNLLKRGLIAPDETEMGVRVDADHVAIDRDGERSPVLLALGPLLKGTLWETVAVPELRGQARRVAEALLDPSAIRAATDEPLLLEYMI